MGDKRQIYEYIEQQVDGAFAYTLATIRNS